MVLGWTISARQCYGLRMGRRFAWRAVDPPTLYPSGHIEILGNISARERERADRQAGEYEHFVASKLSGLRLVSVAFRRLCDQASSVDSLIRVQQSNLQKSLLGVPQASRFKPPSLSMPILRKRSEETRDESQGSDEQSRYDHPPELLVRQRLDDRQPAPDAGIP